MDIGIIGRPSCWGGTELHLLGLARTLAERGHSVSIVSLGSNLFADRLGAVTDRIRVITLGLSKALEKHSLLDIHRLTKNLNFDVLVLEKSSFDLGSLWFDFALRLHTHR